MKNIIIMHVNTELNVRCLCVAAQCSAGAPGINNLCVICCHFDKGWVTV
jgi:hypothetical protein